MPTTAGSGDCRWRRRGSAALAIGHRLVLEEGERSVEDRVLLRRRVLGAGRVDVGLDAVRRDAVVVRREPAADRDPHAAVVLELGPDLDRVLAEGRLADDRAPAMLLWPPPRSPRPMRRSPLTARPAADRIGREPVAGRLRTLLLVTADSWLKISRSHELAGDLLRRVDVAAGVVAEVEDDLVGALVEEVRQAARNCSAAGALKL